MGLAEICYRATADFPKDEIYGLVAQVRRAAGSIRANIAEGHGRESTPSFIDFLRVAQGSLKEFETHILLAQRVRIAENEAAEAVLRECDEIGRMLRAMIRSLQEKEAGDQ
jgi:four helix bundle protein